MRQNPRRKRSHKTLKLVICTHVNTASISGTSWVHRRFTAQCSLSLFVHQLALSDQAGCDMTAVHDRAITQKTEKATEQAIQRWENEGGNAPSPTATTFMTNKKESSLPPAPASVCRCHATREFGHLIPSSILNETFCQQSVDNLNQLLADAMCLRDMYNKHRWQAAGPTFYQLHDFFGKHAAQQSGIIDTIAERIMILGGIGVSMAQEVADTTIIPCPPRDCECPEAQLSRLLEAHEITLQSARPMARQANEMGDIGTGDMLASDVIRVNENQSRLVANHLNVTPPYRVKICR